MGSGSFARFSMFYCVLYVPRLVFHFYIYVRRDKFHRKKCKHNFLGIKFVLCDFELCQLVSKQLW
jgi:hypothetical protein